MSGTLEESPEEGDLVEPTEPGLADDVAAALPGLAASRQRLADEAGRARADGTWAVKANRSSLETYKLDQLSLWLGLGVMSVFKGEA